MKMKHLIFVVMVMFLCFPLFALQLKTSDTLYQEEGHFEEDYIFTGNELVFKGSAIDLMFVGRRLVFDGSTYSSIHAIGETIVINGSIGNDLFAGGSRIDINGKITGTGFLSSGDCTLSSDSVVDGNIFMASGNIKVNGTINGDIYVGAGVFSLNGTVNGNVEVGAGDIIITENGKVNGNFTYSTENKLNESEEQRITGTIDFKEYTDLNTKKIKQFCKAVGIIFAIAGLLSILVSGLLLLLLPCMHRFDYAGSHKQFWYYLLWGLIPFFIYPMVIILTFVLVITIPFGFSILLAWLPLFLVTLILGITVFGQYLFRLFKWENKNRFLYFLFGFLFYFLISLIPFVKILGIIFFSCTGWGIILEKIFKKKFTHNGFNTAQE